MFYTPLDWFPSAVLFFSDNQTDIVVIETTDAAHSKTVGVASGILIVCIFGIFVATDIAEAVITK